MRAIGPSIAVRLESLAVTCWHNCSRDAGVGHILRRSEKAARCNEKSGSTVGGDRIVEIIAGEES